MLTYVFLSTFPCGGSVSVIESSNLAFIEIMGYAGADFVIIDLEHGPNSIQTAQILVRAAELAGSVPIVRVKEGNDSVIGEALDIGAAGIQVPQIETAVQAENVIKRMKFAPEGERGVCRFVRAAQYSANGRFKYFKRANEAVAILQIEGMSGIQNLHEILQVPGIDLLFIGPYGLSQSLGLTGQIAHPLIEEKIHKITKACMQKGVATEIFAYALISSSISLKSPVKPQIYSISAILTNYNYFNSADIFSVRRSILGNFNTEIPQLYPLGYCK